MASSTAEESPPSKPAPTLLTLPSEVQKEIVSHCSQCDLICLALVSKHCRELAAAQLYRNFHIVFPDEDDPAFDSPIDGLAGGLDTFVTSDYDYAKHLRDLSLDTLSGGDKAELAYKPYLYNVSCGKFMNTLLLVTLRKAKALESFRWNIRVELSRPVYQALHRIETLSHIHIRLQAGPSLYESPPPLPYNTSHPAPAAHSMAPLQHMTPVNPAPPPPQSFMVPPPNSLFYVPATTAPPPPLPKPAVRVKAPKKTPLSKEPPTLSGFKKLKSLAVLDIDSLDVVSELKACVRSSSGTLTKLKLSFSDSLANQARKPPPEADPDDSDPDDEFQVVPVPAAGYNDDVSGPARAFRAQEEKKSQESVLGRIFDVEPYVVKKAPKKVREKEKEAKEEAASNPGAEFINAIKVVSGKLMRDLQGAGDLSATQQEILATIEYAARKYVASEEARSRDGNSQEQGAQSSSEASQATPETSAAPTAETAPTPNEASVSLFGQSTSTKAKEAQKDIDPDDIDIIAPEEQLVDEAPDTAAAETLVVVAEPSSSTAPKLPNGPATTGPATPAADLSGPSEPAQPKATMSPSVEKAAASYSIQKANIKTLAEKLELCEAQSTQLRKTLQDLQAADNVDHSSRIAELEKEIAGITNDIQVLKNEMNVVEAEIEDAEKQILLAPAAESAEAQCQRVSEYLRTTRGIALQSLSIYLIPVRASVLSRAIDFRVLRRITLLNVGPQAPIWAHLQKENKESPLPLRKIFTDNVSQVFLTFVSQLEELHEFFILERDIKYKPESFAPKTNTTIDQIRRLVLKKHMPTLKRLMIKNNADMAWDVNEKTVMLICKRGKALEELACNMGIRVIHTYMQHLSGLINLRALHIIQLRNDDTCVWVMRETKRFLIDNLSHHPHLKLEWISIDDEDRVERLIRPSERAKLNKMASKKAKGKQKALTPGEFGGGGNDLFPVLPPPDNWDNAVSDSDDDDELENQRIDSVDNIHFYDVWGVRIFKKEIVNGRL
ncbi:putative f-box domain-protein [Podospora aff. communis PSN243]|uniref:F-box domain-protein n=1 Tax=Podospora aff. communis PSN243 TaxID=3040156 RepID=A0AAV9H349_9PEZI|nr:putative f-box domain-protein [Podospora aff. communis PSN243]